MARHRAEHESDQPTAKSDEPTGESDEPTSESDEPTAESDADDTPDTEDEPQVDEPERTAAVAEFWSDLAVAPIEIALPSGVGYTLRAYRSPDEVTPVPGAEPEPAEGDEPADAAASTVAADEKSGTGKAVTAKVGKSTSAETTDDEAGDDEATDDKAATKTAKGKRRKGKKSDDEESEDETSDDEASDDSDKEVDSDEETDSDEEADDESESDEDEDEEEEEPTGPDEVPVFLTQRGKLLLFHTPEALVEFVRSDEPHSLRGVEQAESLAERLDSTHIAPDEDDHYELDLLVKNLRGGHDTWDPELVISAGELARDLAYALDLQSVQTSLSAGSPLDDLDDAMRGRMNGGIGAFRARRRMRKIGAQQAALAWRTIIGKISAAVDWRD